MEFSGRIFRTSAIAIFASLFLLLSAGSATAESEFLPVPVASAPDIPADPSASGPVLDVNEMPIEEGAPVAAPDAAVDAEASEAGEPVAEPDGMVGAVLLSSPVEMPPGIEIDPNVPAGPRMGSEGALQTGCFVYNVPIEIPPGRQGVQPGIALNYSSSSRNSWVGTGWNLEMGRVQRDSKRVVDYSGDDYVWVSSGGASELVDRSSNWGADYFGAKIEQSFIKFHKINGLPDVYGWEAKDREGKKYYFGTTAASRQDNANGVFGWLMDKVEDPNGNYFTLTYYKDTANGQIYLDRIDYTAHSSLSPTNYVEFIREERPDTIDLYNIVSKVNTVYRLKTIKVWANGDLVRKYELTYEQNPVTTQSRLISVRKYGTDGVTSLPAMTFDYQEGGSGWTSGTPLPDFGKINFDDYNRYPIFAGDFNGDGLTDIGRVAYYNVKFYLATSAGGWDSLSIDPINDFSIDDNYSSASVYPMVIGDFNGDGFTDVGRVGDDTIDFYLADGNGSWTSGTSIANFSPQQGFDSAGNHPMVIGDFNGDGRTDVGRVADIGVAFYLSNDNGGWTAKTSIPTFGHSQSFTDANIYPMIIGDFNGDGAIDVGRVCYNYLAFYTSDPNGGWVRISNISTYAPGQGFANADLYPLAIADINGDGRTDVGRTYATNNTGFYLAANGGWVVNASLLDFGKNLYASDTIYPMFTADVNGDGRVDICRVNSVGVKQYGLDANGLWHQYTAINTFGTNQGYASGGTHPIFTGDFNGDGRNDVARVAESSVGIQKGNAPVPDLMTLVNNGVGGGIDVEYSPSSIFSNSYLPFIVQTVTQIDLRDGISATASSTAYSYTGGMYSAANRDFRGFETVLRTNPDLSVAKTEYNVEDEFLKGLPEVAEYFSPGGFTSEYLLSRSTYTWEKGYIHGNSCYFVQLTGKLDETFDEGVTVSKNSNCSYYDDNGLVEYLTMQGTDGPGIVNHYTYTDTGDWQWRTSVKTTWDYADPLNPVKVGETSFTYDAQGNVETASDWLEGGTNPVVAFDYDAYGNQTSIVDARGYTSTADYADVYDTHAFPVAKTNPLGHVETVEWDYGFGAPLTTTSPNLVTSSHTYDVFGRPTAVSYTNGSETITEYNEYARTVTTRVKESAGVYIAATKWMDGLGREIQTVSPNPDVLPFVVSMTEYDEMGRVKQVIGPATTHRDYYPAFYPPYSNLPMSVSEYDFMGRVTSTQSKVEGGSWAASAFDYAGLTATVTDPDGKQKSTRTDYLGRILETTEYSDAQEFHTYNGYDALGRLTSITDDHNNLTTMAYDTMGRRTEVDDPVSGTALFTYDANGNLLTQTDAKSQVITFTYDPLGRVLTKSYSTNDPTASYTYDDPSVPYSLGKLCAEDNGDVLLETLAFDAMGRPLSVRKTIAGSSPATTSYAYDLSGKTTTVTYPDGYVVTNHYYPATGFLQNVTGSDAVVHAAFSEYEIPGKPGRIGFPNGVYTEYAYDVYSHRLTAITSRDYTGTVIQDYDYDYTDAGNISQISDGIRGAIYSYAYDGLHRLISETCNSCPDQLTVTYDSLGNITSKTVDSDSLAYTYAQNLFAMNGHVLASVSAQGVEYTFTHDANGNMTHGPDLANFAQPGSRDIAYNADDMPLSITDVRGGVPVTTSFLYDGGASRARKTVSGGPTTWYFGDHYEVTNGVATKFIFAGSLRVASITGQDRWSFQNDHLGSSTLVTGPTGAVVEHTEYRPFGQERSHTGQQTDNYKYTGQELDSENGLYNYGARLYDPILGRFLSADAVIKDFADSQSLNHYAYVRNNPLIYTDPTGNFAFLPFIAGVANGAIRGAVIGGTIAAVTGGDIGQGMVTGAVEGAIFNVAGDIISAYHITSAFTQAGIHAAAGAASGAINASIYGGGVGMGALTGGISGGMGKFFGGYLPENFGAQLGGHMMIGGVTGGITAELYGGDFGEGFINGAKTAVIGLICNKFMHNGVLYDDNGKILDGGLQDTIAPWELAGLVKNAFSLFASFGKSIPRMLGNEIGAVGRNVGKFVGSESLARANGMVGSIVRKVGLNKPQADTLHRMISKEGYGYKEILEIAKSIKKGEVY